MSAMLDATCPKCGKRIGWSGKAADRPPCPRCGHQLPAAELRAADAQMDEMMRLMTTHPSEATAADLNAMRKLAGLSRGQVAAKLGLLPGMVGDWETGVSKPSRETFDKLADLYGCG